LPVTFEDNLSKKDDHWETVGQTSSGLQGHGDYNDLSLVSTNDDEQEEPSLFHKLPSKSSKGNRGVLTIITIPILS